MIVTAEDCKAAILEAEERARAGIARDLEGLRGVHGDVVTFIEQRWIDWHDRRVEAAERAFDEANPV